MTDRTKIDEDFQAIGANESSTVEDYKQFYLKYPNLAPEQHAKNYQARADLWHNGNVMIAVLVEMAYSLGGWSSGMQEHGKQIGELVAMAKKDHDHGEDWQGGCDCDHNE